MEEIKFQYHLRNTKPIELSEFTGSLYALNGAFEKASGKKGAELYVNTVRDGSIIVDLIEYIGVGMLGLPDIAPLLVSFAETIFNKVGDAMHRRDLHSWTSDELKEIKDIVSPATKGQNSLELSIVDSSGNVYNNCTFNMNAQQAREVVNTITEEQLQRRIPVMDDTEYTELLVLKQPRDSSNDVGTNGIIERFDPNPKKLLFEDYGTKKIILEQPGNPFNVAYFVKFTPKTANGKIQAYYIKSILDTVPLQ